MNLKLTYWLTEYIVDNKSCLFLILVEINECDGNPKCDAHELCVDEIGYYRCECDSNHFIQDPDTGDCRGNNFKMLSLSFYRSPTKLREGNVYSRVCLFTGGGGFPM